MWLHLGLLQATWLISVKVSAGSVIKFGVASFTKETDSLCSRKKDVTGNYFSYFSAKTYVVGTR